jgi:hypothetical protein
MDARINTRRCSPAATVLACCCAAVAPAGAPAALQAVLINGKAAVWEKGSNHKADLLSSKELTLYHVFKG